MRRGPGGAPPPVARGAWARVAEAHPDGARHAVPSRAPDGVTRHCPLPDHHYSMKVPLDSIAPAAKGSTLGAAALRTLASRADVRR